MDKPNSSWQEYDLGNIDIEEFALGKIYFLRLNNKYFCIMNKLLNLQSLIIYLNGKKEIESSYIRVYRA